VGIAKKSVVFYPVFGLLYLMSGHLRIDRKNSKAAVASMKKIAPLIRDKKLSIYMWPEGTRSRDGRLRPFKKGVVHLAVQTGLPVVPMVVKGAHRAWPATSYTLRPSPIEVEFLPAVKTDDWTVETIDEHVAHLHGLFANALPEDQKPAAPV
jgi:1-acyl-sn-glycerol-3-phosphate acyltransferase